MKKNVVFRIAAIVLMCTLVTACFASSTFAKYTSTATIDGSKLTVAKWDIKYMNTSEGTQLATTTPATITVNLFDDDVKDTKTNATEEDITQGNRLIAPGTYGVLQFEGVKNDSEVTANVEIKVKSITNNDNIPVELKKGDTTLTVGSTVYKGDVAIGATLDKATIGDVTWKWIFDGNDNDDTALGIKARDNGPVEYLVEFEIIVNQVD